MPTGIVLIVIASLLFTAWLIHTVMKHQRHKDAAPGLAREVDALKERVRVLERITVEEGNSLAAEIAALEDRSGPSLNELSRSRSADRA